MLFNNGRSAEEPRQEGDAADTADEMAADVVHVSPPSAADGASSSASRALVAGVATDAGAEKRQRRIERLAELKEDFDQGRTDRALYCQLVAMAYRDEL